MAKSDLVCIDDLSRAQIEALFDVGDKMAEFLHQSHGVLAGYLMGSLFMEPSTRTRLSFESAMNRLGGRVLTMTDSASSSFAKGETLADSVRIVGSYTDIIVLRHPLAGAARVAAMYADVPVINAGDGGHEHPTQTLCDLYTLYHLKRKLTGLKVVLYGDLKYGRTTHSLARALCRFGADVLCIAESGLALPDYVQTACSRIEGVSFQSIDEVQGISGLDVGGCEVSLLTHDLAAWTQSGTTINLDQVACDAIYVTRLQAERFDGTRDSKAYGLPKVDMAFLNCGGLADACVLHPLPRVGEIDISVDADPRGYYFKQAALGVPIRMALLAYLLGRERLAVAAEEPTIKPYELAKGRTCGRDTCIFSTESQYLAALAYADEANERCYYCEQLL